MSRFALLIALVVAVGLGITAWVVSRPAAPADPDADNITVGSLASFDIDHSSIRAFQLIADDGADTVVRSDDGSWVYIAGETIPNDAETVGWPVLPDRAADAVAALKRVEPVTDDGGPGDDASTLLIIMRDGTRHELRIASTALGGRTLVEINGETLAFLDATVAASLTDPGPSAWRLPWALPGVSDASRLSVERRGDDPTVIELRRVSGRWGMTKPVAARAHAPSIAGLTNVLRDIRVEFVDMEAPGAPSRAETGLDDPRMIIRTHRDVRTPVPGSTEVTIESKVRELYIGRPANVDGTMLYASPDEDGDVVLLVPADRMRGIQTSPRGYLAVTATDVPVVDVAGIEVAGEGTTRTYRRSRGEWYEIAEGVEIPMDAAAIEQLMDFLTRQPGEADLSEDGGIREVALIRLMDRSEATMESLSFGTDVDGHVAIVSGPVTLRYTSVTVPVLLPQAGQASAHPRGPVAPGDYNK